jgi:hypothetical protein
VSYNNWFPLTTSGYNTWASLTAEATEATVNGTGELPPYALLAQATLTFTATGTLTTKVTLAGSASLRFSVLASLRTDPITNDIYLRAETDVILYTEADVEILVETPAAVLIPTPLPETIIPATADWRLITASGAYISPLNGKTQTVSRGGERWAVTLAYPNLKGAEAASITAFLAAMRGRAGRVTLPDHAYEKRGALANNLRVNGWNQTGTTLACDGGAASLTNAVRAGDMFELDDRLYMIVADASTNISGNITLEFVPPLDDSPADNATVEVLDPQGYFMLAGNTVSWSYAPGGFTSATSVELIEYRI